MGIPEGLIRSYVHVMLFEEEACLASELLYWDAIEMFIQETVHLLIDRISRTAAMKKMSNHEADLWLFSNSEEV